MPSQYRCGIAGISAALLLVVSRAVIAGPPSNDEQLWLQLVNRFRADPVGELDRLATYSVPGTGRAFASPPSDDASVASALIFFDVDGAELRSQFDLLAPTPPLAWNTGLNDSAEYYAGQIIAADQQAHDLDGLGLVDRLGIHGSYAFAGGGVAAENIFAFADSVEHAHAAFAIDWGNTQTGIQQPPGHRESLINGQFREIGLAVLPDQNSNTSVGPLVVAQHLATDNSRGPFLVGAVYGDQDGSEFYTPGEGMGDVIIELLDRVTSEVVATTTTFDSGGYTLDLTGQPRKQYRVRVRSTLIDDLPRDVDLRGRFNVAMDFQNPLPAIDALTAAVRSAAFDSLFDVNRDGRVDAEDRRVLIEDSRNTYFGDSNLDGEFGSSDLVQVFGAGEYEDQLTANSVWATGDWSGDFEFNSTDLVVAFQAGGYERGPRIAVAAVPEPKTAHSLALAIVCLLAASRLHVIQ